jgi:hypothetical protein
VHLGMLHLLERALMDALDARAGSDTDAARKAVLTRAFRSSTSHRDRFVDAREFTRTIGSFNLGAIAHAGGRRGAPMHYAIQAPLRPKYDVNSELVDALFERYSISSGDAADERLLDIESFYSQLHRSVRPSQPKASLGW